MTIPFVARCAGGTEIDLPNSVIDRNRCVLCLQKAHRDRHSERDQGHSPYAFYGCDTLTKVSFEDSFELIGEHAFEGCTYDGFCALCGRTKEHITNHTAGEWNAVVEPTETACGEKQIVCTVCGEVLERETIAMPEKMEESIDTVSEETSEEVSDEVSAEISETTSMQTSLAPTSSAPTESTAPAPQRGGVPVWVVVPIALCAAACGVGGTYLVIKKK